MDLGWLRPPKRPTHPVALVLGQIRDSLTRIATDTAYTLVDVRQMKEQIMARLDDLDGKLDRDDEGTERQSPEQPATGGPDQPAEPEQPTNPADNPNEQPQR